MMNKSNFKYLKSKVSDFFCVDNLRIIYNDDKYDFRVSFLDFLLCIEDFYTFVYSPKLSKNSWLLFTWLRTLVRYDGYVRLSYKDVSSKFNDGQSQMMSKPTFFKCISELESYGLIKRISNKKLFHSEYQNDTNTYIVISKVDDIIPLLSGMKNHAEFYGILRNAFFNFEKKDISKKSKVVDNKQKWSYDEVMEEYSGVKTEILDFFEFLGTSNKSGKIAKSRQIKILNVIREIYPYNEDLSYAIGQTISKGVKNEKYLFAILRNIYNEQKSSDGKNETEDVDTKEAQLKKKYKPKYKSYKSDGISKEQFSEFVKMIFAKRGGWKTVLQKLKDIGIIDGGNIYEQKLIMACNKRKHKEEILKQASYIRGDRMAILEQYGIEESIRFDKTFNEQIHWIKNGEIVPLSQVKKLMQKYPNEFKLNGAQFVDKEIYNEA